MLTVVSRFQKELASLPQDKAGACHEIKEVIDAITYLYDDIAQAKIDVSSFVDEELNKQIDQISQQLDKAKNTAQETLKAMRCPVYSYDYEEEEEEYV